MAVCGRKCRKWRWSSGGGEGCGVQLPGPGGALGIGTIKLCFLHGGQGPDLSYLPSASLQRGCWRAGEKEESRAGGEEVKEEEEEGVEEMEEEEEVEEK